MNLIPFSRRKCERCERPMVICECLNPYHRKSRVIRLESRKDLCLIGWDEYPWAIQVMTVGQKGEITEHLTPYRSFDDALMDMQHLNSDAVFHGPSRSKEGRL